MTTQVRNILESFDMLTEVISESWQRRLSVAACCLMHRHSTDPQLVSSGRDLPGTRSPRGEQCIIYRAASPVGYASA